MNTQNLIWMAAQAAKEKTAANDLVKNLRKAADLLEKKSVPTVKVDFKAIARERQTRLEKFATSANAGRIKDAKDLLMRSGWVASAANPNVYTNAKHAGLSLQLTGSHFKVTNGSTVVQPTTNIMELQTYVNVLKKRKP